MFAKPIAMSYRKIISMRPIRVRIACVTLLACVFAIHAFSQNLKIYTIDVEQADATLIVSPGGRSLLIDSGDEGNESRIKQAMKNAGISGIDYFVLTHYHADHYGSIDNLATDQSISVGEAFDRGDKTYLPSSKTKDKAFIRYEDAIGARAAHLTRGEMIPLDNGVSVRCVASGGVVLDEEAISPGKDENDMSIGLLIQYGNFIYFNGGDMEKPTEQNIADRDLVMDVDVCKSNHHGSHKCSLPEFMQDLSPSVIIISNGSNSKYKHPRQVSLDTYYALSPKPLVLQTNKYLKNDSKSGNVEDRFIADPESVDDDGTILIVVDKNSSSYKISYSDTTITMAIKPRAVISDNAVVIESLLPNPALPEKDIEKESVTLRNKGNLTVSLTGWYLTDASDRIWSMDGKSIPPASSLTVYRNKMPMSLNDGGDFIRLIGISGQILDTFTYHESVEGVAILTGH
jgi:competence protein ComEC